MGRTSKQWFGPHLLLIALPCVLFWQVFTGHCLLPANQLKDVYPWRTGNSGDLVPWNVLQFDGITQFYPWRLLAAETWLSGYVPLWNPHQFCGTPFLANCQSAVLYPPNLIFLLMPVKFAFGWSDLLHLAFTGLCAYWFFRKAINCSAWAGVIGASCWQLSTWQISWIALPTFLDTSSWLPAALICVHVLARRPTAVNAAGSAVMLAMMILAGHLQIAFYCLALTSAYAVFEVIKNNVPAEKWLKSATVVAGLTFLLTAAQILPTIELSRLSHRAGGTADSAGYAAYTALAMPVEQIAGLFIPGYFGHPQVGTYWGATNYAENAGYIGSVGLLLAVVGLFSPMEKKSKWFFVAVSCFALLIAVGSPLNYLLYYGIPGFSHTGSPARILVIWTFGTAYLAAAGVDLLLTRTREVWLGAGLYVAAALAACGSTAFVLLGSNPGFATNLANGTRDYRLWAGMIIGALAVHWLLTRKLISLQTAAPILFLFVAADLLLANYGYNPTVSPVEVYPITPVIRWLQSHAGDDRIMPVNGRWSLTQPPNAVLPPNSATVYGLYDLQGYDSLQTKRYKQFANELDGNIDSSPVENGNIVFTNGVGSRDSEEADAKYLVTLGPLDGFGDPVTSDGHVFVYLDEKAEPVGGTRAFSQTSPTRIKFGVNVRSSNNVSGINLFSNTAARGSYDAAIQWYPGWRSFDSGGSPSDTSGASVTPAVSSPFMHVTAGTKQVADLAFQPDSFRVGVFLTLLGLLSTVGTALGTLLSKTRSTYSP